MERSCNLHPDLDLTSEDPVLREIFQDIRFCKGLSMAINPGEVDKTPSFGLATPLSYTVSPDSEYNKRG